MHFPFNFLHLITLSKYYMSFKKLKPIYFFYMKLKFNVFNFIVSIIHSRIKATVFLSIIPQLFKTHNVFKRIFINNFKRITKDFMYTTHLFSFFFF